MVSDKTDKTIKCATVTVTSCVCDKDEQDAIQAELISKMSSGIMEEDP